MQTRRSVSRRAFLRGAAMGLAGVALVACTPVAVPQAGSQEGGAVGGQAPGALTMAAGGVPAPYGPAFERQAKRFESSGRTSPANR